MLNIKFLKILKLNRFFKSKTIHTLSAVKLNKSLINLKGPDTYNLLQGLITNEIRQFLNNYDKPLRKSIYTLILQTNGRSFADLILYNLGKETSYVKINNNRSVDFDGDDLHSVNIECDLNVKSNLINLLQMYKLKKNVQLNLIDKQYVWCIFSKDFNEFKVNELKTEKLFVNADPRINLLGYRILSENKNFNDLKNELYFSCIDKNLYSLEEVPPSDYIKHRYKLGIGEGFIDNPSGQCLPLEDNINLLNGVDFNKGCYLGQELIARMHYTGIVRKRLMPIEIIEYNNQKIINNDSDLKERIKFGISLTKQDNLKKKLGKIRVVHENLGLALIYHKEIENCNYMAYNEDLGLLVKTKKPTWWPNDLN